MLEFIGGILMSLGGSVPGVSGGTIAFLMGFFDDMINSVNGLFSRDKQLRKKSFFFLLRLGIGFLIGLALAILLVKAFFVRYIHPVCSLFLGVTLFSVPLIIIEERETIRRRPAALVWILPGAALIVGMTLLAGLGVSGASGWGQILLAFPTGILVACAMIMPGISGAAIFMIFGLYQTVFESISRLVPVHFDRSATPFIRFKAIDPSVLPFVISLGLGALVGIFVVVKGVKWLLKNQRPRTICAILGMMLGSLYSIWVGPTTLETPQPALSLSTFSVWMFLAGAALIGAFEAARILSQRLRQNSAEKQAENQPQDTDAASEPDDRN